MSGARPIVYSDTNIVIPGLFHQDGIPSQWRWYQLTSDDFSAQIGTRRKDGLILFYWPSTAGLRRYMRKPFAILAADSTKHDWEIEPIPFPGIFSSDLRMENKPPASPPEPTP